MYPLAELQIMYPFGAALCHSGLILAALKITGAGMVIPPVLMYDTIVVFVGFSQITVWKLHSPVTPTTVLGWGTSPTPHSSTFHMLLGKYLSPELSIHSLYWLKKWLICVGLAEIALAIDRFTDTLLHTSGCLL